MGSAYGRRRYNETVSLIDWAYRSYIAYTVKSVPEVSRHYTLMYNKNFVVKWIGIERIVRIGVPY